MNQYTALVIVSVALILLTGFTFYLTGSAWSFAILLLIVGMSASEDGGDSD
jgi:hypothetical protein